MTEAEAEASDLLSRRGQVHIAQEEMRRQPQVVQRVLAEAGALVTEATMHFATQSVLYTIVSPHLPPCPAWQSTPEFTLVVTSERQEGGGFVTRFDSFEPVRDARLTMPVQFLHPATLAAEEEGAAHTRPGDRVRRRR